MWTRWFGWAIVAGFAFGGFFDGILLHQILQWHHLLSLVPGLDDLRLQVLWDGYFHALMYVIAAIGLIGLWRAHRNGRAEAGWRLGGGVLVGFGLWHVIDGILSHWLLGIHRIRIDSDIPLFWDLIWFFGFGITPLLIGWLMARRPGGPGRGANMAAMIGLTLAVLGAGSWALVPPPGQPFTTIVFRPGMDAPAVMAALSAVDGRLVWSDAAMGVVVADLDPQRRWDLYGRGALLVSGSGVPAGCLSWSRA